MKTATKIGLGFALPLILFVALALFAMFNITRLVETTTWVRKSQEAVGYGERLVTSMADQESGQRTFLLTGSEQFLSGYKGGQKSFAEAMEGARKAVAGNAEQIARLDKIQALADRFLKEAADKEIEKRREMNRGDATMEDVGWAVKTSTGRPILLELRKIAREFVDAERSQLEEKSAAAEQGARLATWGTLVVTLVALLLAIAAVIVLARNVGGTVRRLAAEARTLTDAVAAGRLGERVHADLAGAEFRPVLTGMNEIMDAYARPVALTSEYVRRIATGEAPPPIVEEFQGDFNVIKESLNDLTEIVRRRGEDIDRLIAAALEGRLDYRADASRYEGGNARVIDGMNRMLDALTQPLKVAASYVDRIARGDVPEKITAEYRGDFDLLKRNLNTCIDAINALIADARQLAEAAVQGKLGVRADAGRHQGDFRTIVVGVNATLDAVIAPLQMAARHVEQISRGEIPPASTPPTPATTATCGTASTPASTR
ncbi:MAG: CHASE3 domain-containing protein [Anaeromyxobacter sp.]